VSPEEEISWANLCLLPASRARIWGVADDTPTILFLCTGNYYRSRFAEEYFNHHAAVLGMMWRAHSLGLAPDFPRLANPGPISKYAMAALQEFGVNPQDAERMPRKALDDDFPRFARWIALSRDEHHSMVNEQHPHLVDQIEFWEVGDLPLETPKDATRKIAGLVDQLLEELAAESQK